MAVGKTTALDVPEVVDRVLGEGAFTVAKFVESFGVIVGAVGGVPNVRELVLRLAIAGRLAEREEPVVETFSTLGPHIRLQTGKLDANAQVQGGKYPFFTCSRTALQIDTYSYDCECVLLSGNGDFHSRYYEGKFDAYQRLYVIESADKSVLSVSYLHKFMLLYSKELEKLSGGGVIQYIKKGHITDAQIRIPPLAEQKRIVARVDQLMALIDQLEAKQNRKREVGTRLTKASLEALTTAESPQEFTTAWTRIQSNWPTLLDSPDKVTEVRAVLLDLTVKGLLVRQEVSEGTAQALVEQCPIRQQELEQAGVFKTTARLEPPSEADCSLEVPSGWRWERLGNLCRFIDYRGKTPSKRAEGVRLITAKNVRMGFVKTDPAEFISEKDYTPWMTRGLPQGGDLLFTTEAPLGNVALFDFSERIALAQRIICLHPYCDLDGRFLMLVMMSPWFQTLLLDKATGMTATGIKASKLKELPVPLAPLAEQKRIVAKVEHLMKLCDALEVALRRSEDRAAKLVEAVVQEMVA